MGELRPVGKAADVVEGGLAAFDVGDHRIAVAKAGGKLYAFDDDCTHEQCSLSDGDLEGTTVTCVCHGSQFDVTTGAVLNSPATEPLTVYPITVESEEIKVEI